MSSFCAFFFAATHFYRAKSNFLVMTSANRWLFVGCVFVTLFITFTSRLIIIFPCDVSRTVVLIELSVKWASWLRKKIRRLYRMQYRARQSRSAVVNGWWSCQISPKLTPNERREKIIFLFGLMKKELITVCHLFLSLTWYYVECMIWKMIIITISCSRGLKEK